MSADTLTFVQAWMSDPLRVASVVPSSARLARLITSELDPSRGPVLELGAGTGVFTRAILQRGFQPSDITIVEMGREFADVLAVRYPEARLLRIDAAALARVEWAKRHPHGAAISGLPLLSMPASKVMRILEGTFRFLDDGGSLYQFTYGWRCPVHAKILDRLGLDAVRIGATMLNFPPAGVYRISRR